MKDVKLWIDGDIKCFDSPDYHYRFNIKTGYFERWGATVEADPTWSPYGAEILDIEISTICHGVDNIPCSFCYKSNTGCGENMSFDTFKSILDKFPKYQGVHLLTQIAFGVGSIDCCPDLWKMMDYCHENNIVPNITINGDRLTNDIVNKLVTKCGAISVSLYHNKDVCYNAVKRLKDAGMKQVNIHTMISNETIERSVDLIYDYNHDERIKNLNAVVFLSLKQKGRGETFTSLSQEDFTRLIKLAVHHKVPFGSDSCGANKILEAAKTLGTYDEWITYVEPCESGAFSSFIDTKGIYFPCSFADKCTQGQDVKTIDEFINIWNSDITKTERNKISDNCRSCPYFNV
jgi:hypothetical protein